MTYKQIQEANTDDLLKEFKKYANKEKDVLQQLECLRNYLSFIDCEITERNKKKMDNHEPCIPEDWWKWRTKYSINYNDYF